MAPLVLFIIVTIDVALACDRPPLAPAQALAEADVVFRGKITNLRYLDDPEQTKTEPRIIVTFEVMEYWKGEADRTLVVHTTHNRSTCNGYAFVTNKEYLVYSRYNRRADNFLARLFAPAQPTLGIKVYGGTKPKSQAARDLTYLGTGSAP